MPDLEPRLKSGVIAILLVTLVAGLAACSASSKRATSSGTSALSVAPPSTSSPPSSTVRTVPSSSASLNSDGSSDVLRAPAGYQLSTDPGTKNGPITPSGFDGVIGAGAAASTHFRHGYDITYDSQITDESIESTLLTFASPADASGFEPVVLENVEAASLSPTKGSVSSIPGSVMLTATKAGPDGFYYIDVIAIKASTIMVLEYANDAPLSGVPDVLSTSVSQQYAAL